MALALDTHSNSGSKTSTSSFSWNHTCGASADILVVFLGARDDQTTNTGKATAVSYNGVAMTEITGAYANTGDEIPGNTFAATEQVWYLLAPGTGSALSVSVTMAHATNEVIGEAVSLSGSRQSAQPDASTSLAATTGTNASKSITTIADNAWILSGIRVGSTPTLTAQNSATIQENVLGTNVRVAAETHGPITPAGAQTEGFTLSASGRFALGVVSIAPSSGSTTPSDTDSATLTDTANKIGLNGPADSASQSDTTAIGMGSSNATTLAEQQAIALLNSDSAAFADQVAIAAATSTSDTAALAESIKIALNATDSAQLGEAMALALANQDSATLQDLVSVALAIADAAALSESASITAHTSSSDAATLSGESGSVTQQGNNPSSNDSGTLSDSASSTAAVSSSDIGQVAEAAAIKLGATDVAALTEQIGLALVAADNPALTEQLHIAVASATSEAASLGELQNVVASILAAAEAAQVSDTAQVTQNGVSSSALKILTLPSRSLTFVLVARAFTFTLPKP